MLRIYLNPDKHTARMEHVEDGDNSIRILYPIEDGPESKEDFEEIFWTDDLDTIRAIGKGMQRIDMDWNNSFNLKPCPKCGGPAIMHRWNPKRGNCYVSCSKCGLEGPKHFKLETHARNDWNHRPPVADMDPDYSPYGVRSRMKRIFRVDDRTRIEDDDRHHDMRCDKVRMRGNHNSSPIP